MQLRILYSFLILLFSISGFSQHDFAIKWIDYDSGETTYDNPFSGGFTITNIGTDTIFAGDTLWYGYLIEGIIFDLGLHEGMVSGEVLDSDLIPEDQITIVNNFEWPALWGSGATIQICAVVFGIGEVSYTGGYFTGDDDPTNNTDCMFAILPEYTSEISSFNSLKDGLQIQVENRILYIFNSTNSSLKEDNMVLNIISINGDIVQTENIYLSATLKETVLLEDFPKGIYFCQFIVNSQIFTKKVYIN